MALITRERPASSSPASTNAVTASTKRATSWLVVATLAFAIGYPILQLLLVAFRDEDGFTLTFVSEAVVSPELRESFLVTLGMVLPSTLLAVAIGTILAWSNARTDATLGVFGQILPLTTFVVPHIAIATGWSLLGTPNVGFLSSRLEALPLIGEYIPSIYSMSGLIFVETITLVPFVFLVLQPAFANLDPALEEASLSAGAGAFRTLIKISIPAVKNAVAGATLLAIIVGFGEYTVPLILGTPSDLQTLSVVVLHDVTATYPPRLGEGAVIGLFMLLITVGAWLAYLRTAKEGRLAQVGGKFGGAGVIKLGGFRWLIWGVVAAFFTCATVLPVLALLVVALQPFWTPEVDPSTFGLTNFQAIWDNPSLSSAITNSVKFAFIGALAATIIVMFLTSASKIAGQRSAAIGLGLIKIPSAIAPLVLAVGILVAFYGQPFNLGNTQFILVATYVVLFLPHASLLGESAVKQIRHELIEASNVAGASWFRTHRKILAPLTAPAFIGIFALCFTIIMGETSASRVLAGPDTQVAGFAIVQVYGVGLYGQVAVLAALVAIVNCVVVAGLMTLSRAIRRKW
ncbi:ABC transporter permease [Pseudarthrobacter sp. YAF2]|uniref:ABC transporter permease n=1 Tax=Pseudarthrobacter sp. YAF2 TaxID=3233078 RepID=UPI003F9B9CC4